MALGAAPQKFLRIEITWVLEIHRTTQLHTGEFVGTCQRHAAVLGIAGVEVAAKRLPTGAACGKVDQVGHAVAVHHRREGACALPIAQAQLDVAAGFGLQRRVAVLAEALVQRGRAECRARRSGGAPARCKGVAVGQAARALAAEFAVAVVAQVGLHGVRACAEAVAQRQRVLRTAARGAAHQRGVFKLVLTALQRSAQAVCTETPVVLPQVAAQLRLREVGRRCGFITAERLVHREARAVGVAPLGCPVRTSGVQAAQVAVVIGRGRFVGESVVARVESAHEQVRANAVLRIDAVAQARGGTGAAVAIVVGVVGAAGLGVKTIAARMRQAHRIVHRTLRPGRATHTRLNLACTLVAKADTDKRYCRAFALARKKLDHAANGV